MPSALDGKKETTNMDKRKLRMTLEVLNEESTEFPETKEFIEEKLEQKCSKKIYQ